MATIADKANVWFNLNDLIILLLLFRSLVSPGVC